MTSVPPIQPSPELRRRIQELTPHLNLGWVASAFLIAAYFVPTMRELLTSLLPIELGSTATSTYVGEYYQGRFGSEAYAEIYEFSHFALGFLTVELFAAVLFVAVGHKSVTVGLWRYQETLFLLGVVALTLLLLFLPTAVCGEQRIRPIYRCADGQGPWLALWVSALMTSVLLPLFPAFLISMAKYFLPTQPPPPAPPH